MNHYDFKNFEKGLSQSKAAKNTTPLLTNVKIAQFRKKSTSLFYKESFKDTEFKESFFLKKNLDLQFKNQSKIYLSREENRGINSEKKENIIKELFDLIPANRRVFYINLKANNSAVDMIDAH